MLTIFSALRAPGVASVAKAARFPVRTLSSFSHFSDGKDVKRDHETQEMATSIAEGKSYPLSDIPYPPLAAFMLQKDKKKSKLGAEQKVAVAKIPSIDSLGRAYAIGRRKTATARVWIKPGTGVVTVNKKLMVDYFSRDLLRTAILTPFKVTGTVGNFDVESVVQGSGKSSQAEAIMLGVARALQPYKDENRSLLKSAGLLTSDPRQVERKKYGQRKARKKFQWVKR